MAIYKPQKKHRAHHGNYISKPSKMAVVNLMMLYAGIDQTARHLPVIKQVGKQLKLEY